MKAPTRRATKAEFAETIADAKAKISKAEFDAFTARLKAVDTILEHAQPHDVLMVCARALAQVIPICCEKHQDEFKADFLRALSDHIAMVEEAEAAEAEAEGDVDAPPQVH